MRAWTAGGPGRPARGRLSSDRASVVRSGTSPAAITRAPRHRPPAADLSEPAGRSRGWRHALTDRDVNEMTTRKRLLYAALLTLPLGVMACVEPTPSRSSTTGAYAAFPAARTGVTEQGSTDAPLPSARA